MLIVLENMFQVALEANGCWWYSPRDVATSFTSGDLFLAPDYMYLLNIKHNGMCWAKKAENVDFWRGLKKKLGQNAISCIIT